MWLPPLILHKHKKTSPLLFHLTSFFWKFQNLAFLSFNPGIKGVKTYNFSFEEKK